MKRALFAVLSFGFGLTAASPSAAAAPAADPGKAAYEQKCASCHGKDGKGKAAMAKSFKVEPSALDLTSEKAMGKSDEDLLKVIDAGKGKMPAFKGKLSAEQQGAVLKYFRSLAPKK